VDGSPESEKAVVDEVPAHDGAEEMMERTDGRGSDARYKLYHNQPRVLPSVSLLVDSFYIR